MPATVVEFHTLHQYQYQLYDALLRWNCFVCHRRFGKTVLCLQILLVRACANTLLLPRYAYVAPLYKQAKAAAWDYLRTLAGYIPGTQFWENELRCRLPHNGAEIRLLGADNPDALRGIYLDGVVLDEYAQMRPRVWHEVVRPTLSDRLRQGEQNQWAVFIGTPYGKNHFYELYMAALQDAAWSTALLRASQTGVLAPEELDLARAQMSDSAYEQEYECSWLAALPGAYYADEFRQVDADGRIGQVPYDASLPTYTAWDIGFNDETAIWFCQPQKGGQVRVIDYYENSGHALPHYIDVVRRKPYIYDQSKLPFPLTRESYEVHYGPHDLENTEFGSGKTRYGIALAHGLRFTVIPRAVNQQGVADGIAAVRQLLGRCVFDERRCAPGIEALRSYRRQWDDLKQTFADIPYHDRASNGADAARYLAIGLLPALKPPGPTLPLFSFGGQLNVIRRRKGVA